jgi:putative two-component system response regulator
MAKMPPADPSSNGPSLRTIPGLLDSALIERAHVLIVDDEIGYVTLLRRMLSRAGFTDVRSTTDPRGVGALVAAEEPDIILLDLHMPERDGFQVLEALASRTGGDRLASGRMPVLVLTGDATAASKRRALALGATDFVAKPFDAPEVVLRIRNLLETRLLHRALREQNVALEAIVQARTHELEKAQTEVLERLAIAGEFRDDDTGEHTRRVGEGAARLGRILRLPQPMVELVRRAAPLHDVGKIGIPDSVLLKPGRLTPDELTVMRTHTTLGAAMLAGGRTPLVQMAERIARSHHERWDGGGYPDQLAGGAIPVEARLVAVADVYDALTSDRPYRAAWERDRVIAHIRMGAGSHFDPDIVAAFLSAEGAEHELTNRSILDVDGPTTSDGTC